MKSEQITSDMYDRICEARSRGKIAYIAAFDFVTGQFVRIKDAVENGRRIVFDVVERNKPG